MLLKANIAKDGGDTMVIEVFSRWSLIIPELESNIVQIPPLESSLFAPFKTNDMLTHQASLYRCGLSIAVSIGTTMIVPLSNAFSSCLVNWLIP